MALKRLVAAVADDAWAIISFAALEYGIWHAYEPAAFVVGGAIGLAAWWRRNLRPTLKF